MKPAPPQEPLYARPAEDGPPRRRLVLGAAATAAIGTLGTFGLPRPAAALQAGQTIPSLMLDTAEGPQPIAPARARVTYVDFWASWCGPCRQSFPWMNEMQAKYGSNGLRIVAVNVDARRDEADEFLARNPARFAIAFDRQRALAQAVDVKAMPTSLLVDPRGRVLLVHQGFAGKDREKLESAIEQALRDGGGAPRS